MNIKPIRTDADYRAALKEVEALMRAKPNTPEGKKLDVLVTLIEAYERKQFPLDFPDPVEAIKFEMEQKGLTINLLRAPCTYPRGKTAGYYGAENQKRRATLTSKTQKL